MTAAMLSYTEQKAEVLDFGYPLMYYSYAVAIKTPELTPLKFVLFNPFQNFVWLSFFVSFLLAIVCIGFVSFASSSMLPHGN